MARAGAFTDVGSRLALASVLLLGACARPALQNGAHAVGGNGVPDASSGVPADAATVDEPADLSVVAADASVAVHDLAPSPAPDLSQALDLAAPIVVDMAAPPDLSTACAHPICTTGVKLVASCDPCATQICVKDPYCCNTSWNSICVGEVASICMQACS